MVASWSFYLVVYSVAPATGQLGSSSHPYSYVVPYGARRVQQQFFRNDLMGVIPDFLFWIHSASCLRLAECRQFSIQGSKSILKLPVATYPGVRLQPVKP